MSCRIYNWSQIARDFTDGLLLGNGASIAVDERFNYPSLRDQAGRLRALTPNVEKVFSFLGTDDFELVLRVLWHAQNVNLALGVSESLTQDAYNDVRSALMRTVRSVHAPYGDVVEKLQRGIGFLSHFRTVASLNYDLLVYWTFMLGNADTPNRFKDCFVGGEFQQDWQRFREPYGTAGASTLVFYPHGNLVIGADIVGVEQKIHADDFSTLLDTVISEWEAGRLSPVFVSEGTSEQKMRSIHRSPYLLTVYEEVLPSLGEDIAVYGWSVSDQDDHIIRAICKRRPRRLAFSVRRNSPQLDDMCNRVQRKLDAHLGRNSFELFFFDAASSGAWVIP